MNNLSSIDIKFLLSLFADPWLLAVHLLDILIVAYLIYRFIKALTGTKIMSLVQGVIFFLVLRFIAEWIGFTTITYLMNQVITYGVIAGVVILPLKFGQDWRNLVVLRKFFTKTVRQQ